MSREVQTKFENIEQLEGAGVKIRRSIGTRNVKKSFKKCFKNSFVLLIKLKSSEILIRSCFLVKIKLLNWYFLFKFSFVLFFLMYQMNLRTKAKYPASLIIHIVVLKLLVICFRGKSYMRILMATKE